MKNLRVSYLLLVLVGWLFASCNEGTQQGPSQWAGVVKVNVDGSFSDAAGLKLIPTMPSTLSASMAYIYCQYDQAGLTSNKLKITLLAEPESIDGKTVEVPAPGDSEDVKANVAITDLRVSAGTGAYTPVFFDAQTLLLPISFFVKSENDATAALAEQKRHHFPLVYYKSAIGAGDTDLKLYLRHVVMGDVSTPRTKGAWLWRAYPLADVLRQFKAQSGNEKPFRIVIHYDQNFLSDQLGVTHSTEKMIEIPYGV